MPSLWATLAIAAAASGTLASPLLQTESGTDTGTANTASVDTGWDSTGTFSLKQVRNVGYVRDGPRSLAKVVSLGDSFRDEARADTV